MKEILSCCTLMRLIDLSLNFFVKKGKNSEHFVLVDHVLNKESKQNHNKKNPFLNHTP